MGRKGFKNFVKAKRPGEEGSDAEEEQKSQETQPIAAKPAAAAAGPAAASPAKAAPAGSDDEGSGSDAGEHGGPESRGHMLQRHKREMLAHKKAMQRSGKKKDDVAKLTAALEKKHAEELKQLDAGGAGGGTGGSAAAAGGGGPSAPDPLSKFMKGLSVDSQEAAAQARRPSKAQKRREKHAAKDAEREARIAAEKEALGTPERLAEEAALKELLTPLGLGIREIRADGHCMYRSIEDQLRSTAGGGGGVAAASGSGSDADEDGVPSYQDLRETAAAHMRAHRDTFSPYLVPEDESEDPSAYFDRYCDTLEMTAAWGGHVELHALAEALRRRITVYGVGMEPQVLGAEFGGEGLTICFLRHALGLGAHYNSTQKLLFGPGGAGGDNDEGAAEGDD